MAKSKSRKYARKGKKTANGEREVIPAAAVEIFLKELAGGHSVQAALDKAGIKRSTAYDLRKVDKAFREAWEIAYDEGTDLHEEEASRRAIVGTKEPIIQQGKVVGHRTVFSDRLLEIILRARRPQVYRETFVHKHGGDKANPTAIPIDIKGLTDDQLEQLKKRILAGLGLGAGAGTSSSDRARAK